MKLFFDFSAFLGLATAVTGLLWLLDTLCFKAKRMHKQRELLTSSQLIQSKKELTEEQWNELLKDKPELLLQTPRIPKWADYSKSFFPVLLAVFVLRAFIVEPFRIPSGSMRPTLVEGDFILVNKYAYGLRLPLTGTKLLDFKDKPHRGDIIVFRSPENPKIDFIKRLVGLPGDTVSYKDKKYYINGKELEQDYVETSMDSDLSGSTHQVKHYKEHMNSSVHSIYVSRVESSDYPETVIPAGHYFMSGDNRDFSRDSREWGFVPEELILGQAFYIWLSFDSLKKDLRWNRFGMIENQHEPKEG